MCARSTGISFNRPGRAGAAPRAARGAAGERISGEAVRDLVGAGFVHITTSRLVVTEEGDTWLRSTEAELSSHGI